MFGAKACPFFGLVFGVNFGAMFKETSWVEQLAAVSACVDKWQGPDISWHLHYVYIIASFSHRGDGD